MSILGERSLRAFVILLVLVVAGCKQQSSAPPSSPSTSASEASASAPPSNASNAPATSTNASQADKAALDACKLLTADEIKSVQADALKNVTPSPASTSPFITSQCFYATNDFVNSVSLTVTQQSSGAGAQNLREFWKERFGSIESREKERERERDRDQKARGGQEEEEGAPPERVKGIGEEAYSVGNAKIGALYVLKGDKFLRISVGGSHSQPERIAKMKKLAQYALNRL